MLTCIWMDGWMDGVEEGLRQTNQACFALRPLGAHVQMAHWKVSSPLILLSLMQHRGLVIPQCFSMLRSVVFNLQDPSCI